MPLAFLALAAVLLATLAGCAEKERRPEEPTPITSSGAPPFEPPSYRDGRSIDTIATARLGGGRVPLFVIGSRGDSTLAERFDLLEIFAFDSLRGSWMRVLSDSVEAAHRLELRDITGDGNEDLIVRLDYGGNEPVSTNGMHVYTAHGGAVRRVFRSTWMDPHIDTGVGVRGPVITVRHAIWPLFAPRSDAAIYTDDIFAYREGRFRSVVGEARAYFAAEADSALSRYRPLRDTVERDLDSRRRLRAARRDSLQRIGTSEADSIARVLEAERDTLRYGQELRLYQSAALIVLYRLRSGDERGARAFWSRERTFLRSALREEQYDELAAFTEQLLSPG